MAKAKLGVLFEELHGKVGNVVVEMIDGEANVRPLPKKNDPKTPLQLTARRNFSSASKLFKNTLTIEQQAAWRAYAKANPVLNIDSGKRRALNPVAMLNSLTSKFLQINPGGTPPVNPPAFGFGGDPLTLSVSTDDGAITFTASAANSAGVKTEILLQKVPTFGSPAYGKEYRSKEFVAFAVGSLSTTLFIPGDYYAAAYRFVKVSTGQMTDLVPLGTYTIP